MKIKKILLSASLIALVCMLVAVGIAGGIRKKPIEVKEMSYAEVIEYEAEDNDGEVSLNEDIENIENNIAGSNDVENDNNIEVIAPQVEEENFDFSICVFGRARTQLSPDRATITASIQTLDSEMVKSKENSFLVFDSIIKALKDIGIEEECIILEHFNCHPNFDYEYGRKIIGYRSTADFSIKLDSLDKIKKCVDVMTEKGVTEIRDVVYEVSSLEEEYNNTLTSAVENARIKAEKVLGRTDLKIARIKEEFVYSCNNIYRNYAENMSASDLIGKVDIEAKVLVEFN